MVAPAGAVAFDPQKATKQGKGRKIDLEEIHDFAVNAALEAGALLRKRSIQQSILSRGSSAASSSKLQIKSSEVDLVTDLDIQVEELIRAKIEQHWPGHGIIAEESYGKNADVKSKWQRSKQLQRRALINQNSIAALRSSKYSLVIRQHHY